MGEPSARMSEPPGLPGPGETLDGKYRLLRVVGEGGMGIVFEAVHLKLGQRVAIKVLQPSIANDADLVTRFDREARAAGRLRGRNVARVTDVETSPGKLPYMVMEYLEGHDLEAELARHDGRRMPVPDAVDIVLQACRAIAEAHAAGIVHRDLKPSNLFLCDEAGELVVKLLDFGVSKMEGEASKLTSTQLVIGTVYYMSPEQIRSAKRVDHRADIWALSVILYELLAGQPPFLGSATSVAVSIVNDEATPLSDVRDVPPGLAAAILKGMAKNPDARFGDVGAFALAIAPYGVSGAPSSTRWRASPPVVVVTPGESGAALGNARTVHESASSPNGHSLLPAAPARTSSRVQATHATARPRRLALRVAAGAMALGAVLGLTLLTASRAPAARPATAIRREATAANAHPLQASSGAVPPGVASATTAPAPASAPADADPHAVLASTSPPARARPATLPKTPDPSRTVHAAATLPSAPRPSAPTTPPKKGKAPLVAPF